MKTMHGWKLLFGIVEVVLFSQNALHGNVKPCNFPNETFSHFFLRVRCWIGTFLKLLSKGLTVLNITLYLILHFHCTRCIRFLLRGGKCDLKNEKIFKNKTKKPLSVKGYYKCRNCGMIMILGYQPELIRD